MSLAERNAIAEAGKLGDAAQPLPAPTNDEIRRQLGFGLITPSAECAR